MKQLLQSAIRVWWPGYIRYIDRTVGMYTQQDEGDVSYWHELSFVKIVAYLIPISLLVFIPRVIIGFYTHHIVMTVFDIVCYTLLCTTLLYKGLPARFKKLFMVVLLYIFSIVLLFVEGSDGKAIIYLTCISIFTIFIFKGNLVYLSFAANIVIVFSTALLIHYHPFKLQLTQRFTPLTWLDYSSSILFINLICLLFIQQIISRLEKIIIRESELQGQLADEMLERQMLNNKLQESEDYYRYLFSSNPIPMWVYDTTTLCFLQVNDAAIRHYGYSREEFLNMTIEHIHPAADIENLNKVLKTNHQTAMALRAIAVHVKKNNKAFPVEIRSNPIEINGKVGRLVLATDITERTRYVNDIEEQNKRLKHIAWIQSHKVRAPLARVMSLTDLLSRELTDADKEDVLRYLIISTNELNDIVTTIIKQAEAE